MLVTTIYLSINNITVKHNKNNIRVIGTVALYVIFPKHGSSALTHEVMLCLPSGKSMNCLVQSLHSVTPVPVLCGMPRCFSRFSLLQGSVLLSTEWKRERSSSWAHLPFYVRPRLTHKHKVPWGTESNEWFTF